VRGLSPAADPVSAGDIERAFDTPANAGILEVFEHLI
jgi:hypothetical protein